MTDLKSTSQEANQNAENQKRNENWKNYPDFLLTKEEKRILRKEKHQMTLTNIFLFIINLPFLIIVVPVFSLGFFFEKGFEVPYLTFKAFLFRVLFVLNILFIIAGLLLLAIVMD